jgi:hypothetical protein
LTNPYFSFPTLFPAGTGKIEAIGIRLRVCDWPDIGPVEVAPGSNALICRKAPICYLCFPFNRFSWIFHAADFLTGALTRVSVSLICHFFLIRVDNF